MSDQKLPAQSGIICNLPVERFDAPFDICLQRSLHTALANHPPTPCISSDADISKASAERVLTSVMNTIMDAVAGGDRVTLVGFGTFHASKRAGRTGLNPRTGEKIEIAAANVPKFTPGAAFKEAANKAK